MYHSIKHSIWIYLESCSLHKLLKIYGHLKNNNTGVKGLLKYLLFESFHFILGDSKKGIS